MFQSTESIKHNLKDHCSPSHSDTFQTSLLPIYAVKPITFSEATDGNICIENLLAGRVI